MKPIRLKKDNVVHVVHSAVDRVRLATQADVTRTLANPSAFGWPCCWVCTDLRMQQKRQGQLTGAFGETTWIPVEEYGIVDQRADEWDVRAKCSHGNPQGRWFEDTKVLSMPHTWSIAKKRHKLASIVFFVGAEATPLGGNLVQV